MVISSRSPPLPFSSGLLSNSHSLFVPPPIVSPLQGCSASHFGQPTMFFSQLIRSEVLVLELGYSCTLNIWKCSCLNPIKLCQLLFLDPKSQLGSKSGGYNAKSGELVHRCISDCCTTADLFPSMLCWARFLQFCCSFSVARSGKKWQVVRHEGRVPTR